MRGWAEGYHRAYLVAEFNRNRGRLAIGEAKRGKALERIGDDGRPRQATRFVKVVVVLILVQRYLQKLERRRLQKREQVQRFRRKGRAA